MKHGSSQNVVAITFAVTTTVTLLTAAISSSSSEWAFTEARWVIGVLIILFGFSGLMKISESPLPSREKGSRIVAMVVAAGVSGFFLYLSFALAYMGALVFDSLCQLLKGSYCSWVFEWFMGFATFNAIIGAAGSVFSVTFHKLTRDLPGAKETK